jgi:hypothetical protein
MLNLDWLKFKTHETYLINMPFMKKNILLFFVLFSCFLTSQNNKSLTYNFDAIVSLDVPRNFIEVDTLIDGVQIHQVSFKTDTYNFIAQKVLFENENQKESLSRLPYDYASLMDEYNRVVAMMKIKIPYQFKSKDLVEKEGYKGYNLKFVDAANNPTYETEFYLLNKNLYSFFYASESFDIAVKDSIFNSIKINTDHEISQYLGKPPKYRIGYVIATYFFLSLIIIGVIIYAIKIYRKKTGKTSIFHE